MKKVLVISVLFLTACSSRDEQFCECLQAGDALNKESQKFMSELPTEEDAARINELKQEKTDACKNYTEMAGDEMRRKKKECAED